MSVAGIDPMAVLKHDRPSVATHKVSESHRAIRRSDHRLPNHRRDIDAGMEGAFSVERIRTFAKRSGYLAFHGPEIRSRVGTSPISRRDVARQAKGESGGRCAGQS